MSGGYARYVTMNPFGFVGRMLLLLALAGLLLAPLGEAIATPAMSAQAMTAMTGDMDCCPKHAPSPDCRKDCPFVAFCFVGIGNVLSTEPASFHLRLGDGFLIPHGHDFELASLTGKPPSRPPRL